MTDFRQQFIAFAIDKQVLRFGEFITKAGRKTPYFFNTGLFNDGDSLRKLGQFYAKAILESGLEFDVLFGPAYKGIPLAASIAIALSEAGRNVPFSFNRKEAKDHGEGGTIVGAPLKGKVLIVDDVISAGTSIRESVEIIRVNGAAPCGVFIALDRQERGSGELSAVQEVERSYGIPVFGIASLAILIEYLRNQPHMAHNLDAIERYQSEYGIAS
ncbi:MAG TPA: orotate phosphoribosyltransferase, partial [Methylophilaceae bacterium]|nr:orotate phosphoribosyltransferase [Methylophilaceae bacterium]HQR60100.1 orotate phosphoribosyltransferase [Methylophilaceae bacterium]